MTNTSASLLDRLRHDPQSPEWERLVRIYTPFVRGWLRRQSAPESDAEDLVQEVMAVVVRRLPEFEHNRRTGAFRTWLRSITVNSLHDFWRRKKKAPNAIGGSDFAAALGELADPRSNLSQAWDREHDLHVTRQLLEQLRPEFEAATWKAFQRFAIDGVSAAEVAQELGISSNAVFIAKSRVLSRLRQEAAGLIEDDEGKS